MLAHPVRWQAPQPLWTRFGADGTAAALAPEQARPSLLRFASDDFMDQMLATLARDPSRIDAHIAKPETWRTPAGESADLISRTPLPSVAQSSSRLAAAFKPKARVLPAVPTPAKPLKLYQPAHQRHYLVSASLVCAQPGLPERGVVPGSDEQLNFVIRRLLPGTSVTDTSLHEFAFVKDADGTRWQRIGAPPAAGRAVAGEDALPLFPLVFSDDAGATRTLWTGSVPVGRREDYMASKVDRTAVASFAEGQLQSLAVQPPVAAPTVKLARMTQFQMEVAEPWKSLIRSSYAVAASVQEVSGADGEPDMTLPKAKRVFDFNLQQQNVSWLVLLDLADYIETYLSDLWGVILADGVGATSLPTLRRDIHTWLAAAVMPAALVTGLRVPGTAVNFKTPSTSMRAALKAIRQTGVREALEAAVVNYDSSTTSNAAWPSFHFVLAGLSSPANAADGPFLQLSTLDAPAGDALAEPLPGRPIAGPLTPSQQVLENARLAAEKVDRLTSLVGRALNDSGDASAPPLPYALQLKNALNGSVNDPGWFVIRFVYTRRDCGPLHPPTVSAPTERFQLANFFDSDAPARPVRITLPADTSPAGLRKFPKNTAFVLSDMLCGQVQRAKGLGLIDLVRSVLPWPLHKDLDVASGSCQNSGGINIGMICSLSIPIVTICALILLMIIVSLLDFIFRWLPYFIICFPVPGLKGKK